MHIPSGKLRPRPAMLILVFDPHRLAWRAWQARMNPNPRLNAGLLLARQDKLVLESLTPLPRSRVQVHNARGLELELRISCKYPAPMPPGSNRILVQPPPHAAIAHARHHTLILCVLGHIGYAQP